MDRDNLKYTNVVLERIAAALEETLRLVKKDQEASKKKWDEPKVRENPESIQTKWLEELKIQWCLYTIGAGSRPMDIKKKLQAASNKLQAWQD